MLDPGQPASSFDTLVRSGTGKCNGVSGAVATWKLTDAGEPGRADRFEISIQGPGCSPTAAGFLDVGNHQAHAKA